MPSTWPLPPSIISIVGVDEPSVVILYFEPVPEPFEDVWVTLLYVAGVPPVPPAIVSMLTISPEPDCSNAYVKTVPETPTGNLSVAAEPCLIISPLVLNTAPESPCAIICHLAPSESGETFVILSCIATYVVEVNLTTSPIL